MTGYRLTQQAEQDLHGIWAYIAQDSPSAADAILNSFYDAFSRLGEFPRMGQQREDLSSEPLRFFPVRSYLITYRSEVKPIVIYRVLSGYRDIVQELE